MKDSSKSLGPAPIQKSQRSSGLWALSWTIPSLSTFQVFKVQCNPTTLITNLNLLADLSAFFLPTLFQTLTLCAREGGIQEGHNSNNKGKSLENCPYDTGGAKQKHKISQLYNNPTVALLLHTPGKQPVGKGSWSPFVLLP